MYLIISRIKCWIIEQRYIYICICVDHLVLCILYILHFTFHVPHLIMSMGHFTPHISWFTLAHDTSSMVHSISHIPNLVSSYSISYILHPKSHIPLIPHSTGRMQYTAFHVLHSYHKSHMLFSIPPYSKSRNPRSTFHHIFPYVIVHVIYPTRRNSYTTLHISCFILYFVSDVVVFASNILRSTSYFPYSRPVHTCEEIFRELKYRLQNFDERSGIPIDGITLNNLLQISGTSKFW